MTTGLTICNGYPAALHLQAPHAPQTLARAQSTLMFTSVLGPCWLVISSMAVLTGD